MSLGIYPRIVVLVLGVCLMSSCGLNSRDVQGLYMGIIHDLSDKNAEFVVQLYADGSYALRKIVFEEGSRPIFRKGNWSIQDTKIILMADGEKDLRFKFEKGCLKLEAGDFTLGNIPNDQLSLLPIGK